ncbi:hypothetical protein ACVBAX_25160 [Robertmurraya sp. GLU-23]
MSNQILIENINKEQLLTEFTNFKELHKRVIPTDLHSSLSTNKDEYLSFYFLVREIYYLDRTEIFKKFNFSQEEEIFVTDVLKTAKESKVPSMMALAYERIGIPGRSPR